MMPKISFYNEALSSYVFNEAELIIKWGHYTKVTISFLTSAYKFSIDDVETMFLKVPNFIIRNYLQTLARGIRGYYRSTMIHIENSSLMNLVLLLSSSRLLWFCAMITLSLQCQKLIKKKRKLLCISQMWLKIKSKKVVIIGWRRRRWASRISNYSSWATTSSPKQYISNCWSFSIEKNERNRRYSNRKTIVIYSNFHKPNAIYYRLFDPKP